MRDEGFSAYRDGRYDEAAFCLRSVIDQGEYDSEVLDSLIRSLVVLDRRRECLDMIKLLHTSTEEPISDDIILIEGQVYTTEKDYVRALESYQSIPATSEYAQDAFMAKVRIYIDTDRIDEIIVLYDARIGTDQLDIDKARIIESYRAALRGGDLAQAIGQLEALRSLDPQDADVLIQIGFLAYRTANYYRASGAFVAVTDIIPEHPVATKMLEKL